MEKDARNTQPGERGAVRDGGSRFVVGGGGAPHGMMVSIMMGVTSSWGRVGEGWGGG